MDQLYAFQNELSEQIDNRFYRSVFDRIDWQQRMFGITGLRGVGKTTMLLQFQKYVYSDYQSSLYVTADHTWFYEHTLADLADQFVRYGGKLLLIDEIHKYPRWSRELKNIYDGHPDLQVIFTASSALDIFKGEADLSRRALTYETDGLSFREYLELVHNMKLPVVSLGQLLGDPAKIASQIQHHIKPLPLFRDYLRSGYFPFITTEKEPAFLQKLNQIINTVLESDLQFTRGYSAAHIIKLKKILGVIAESAPFEPNISKLAGKLGLGRDTVKAYLYDLHKARLLNHINRPNKDISSLQKPDKIYLENTNFSYALKASPDTGNLRETFFINQLRNAGYNIALADQGDFLVNDTWTFEVGGRSKDTRQISRVDNAYLALDEMEHPWLNRIPLWMFGFLY